MKPSKNKRVFVPSPVIGTPPPPAQWGVLIPTHTGDGWRILTSTRPHEIDYELCLTECHLPKSLKTSKSVDTIRGYIAWSWFLSPPAAPPPVQGLSAAMLGCGHAPPKHGFAHCSGCTGTGVSYPSHSRRTRPRPRQIVAVQPQRVNQGSIASAVWPVTHGTMHLKRLCPGVLLGSCLHTCFFPHHFTVVLWHLFTSDRVIPIPAGRRRDQVKMVFLTGSWRMRLPVAANNALQIAGTIGGTPGSPTPAGKSWLGTRYTCVS